MKTNALPPTHMPEHSFIALFHINLGWGKLSSGTCWLQGKYLKVSIAPCLHLEVLKRRAATG